MRWAALLLLACAPPPPEVDCLTFCGVKAYSFGDCRALQRAEDALLLAVAESHPEACSVLDGWHLTITPNEGGRWWTVDGETVAGTTYCDYRAVYLGDEDHRTNAYAHEMLHALECPRISYSHSTWTWEWAAIDEARRLYAEAR
jgi:hypothetical protein